MYHCFPKWNLVYIRRVYSLFCFWTWKASNGLLDKPKYLHIYSTLTISRPQRRTPYLCKQTNVCALKRPCVRCLIFQNRIKPWCNGASGQPRTACVLPDYKQIRSTRLSLFGCMSQDWNGLEQTAHGAAILQWFAFTCREFHPWLACKHDDNQPSHLIKSNIGKVFLYRVKTNLYWTRRYQYPCWTFIINAKQDQDVS